jgi:NAD(P)-dependent dehydrogenase (short-subunit alcohol dehydrogenase family)
VAIVARGKKELDAAVGGIRAEGGTVLGIEADIRDMRAIHPIAAQVAEAHGPPTLVVNNASTLGPVPLRPLDETECEDLGAVLETNVVGPFRLTKALLGSMQLREEGIVVNISSDAAVSAYSGWGAYSVSKAALDHLGRIWAEETAGTGVRFLSVDPGEMDTVMHEEALPGSDRATLARPEDVAARLVALLESGGFRSGERRTL